MNLESMRRRVRALEAEAPSLVRYPPLTRAEIDALAKRAAAREPWTVEEQMRVFQQCPITQGEYHITAGIEGGVVVKRYGGIDIEQLAKDPLHPGLAVGPEPFGGEANGDPCLRYHRA